MHRAVALVAPSGAVVAAGIALVELARRWTEAAWAQRSDSAMVPATAVGVLLGAVALLLVYSGARGRRVGHAVAVCVAALGLLVMVEYAIDGDLRADDRWLLRARGWWLQRPGPTTGLALALLGGSLMTQGARSARVHRCSGALAAGTILVAVTGLVGHAYGADVLYGVNPWGGTAVTAALAIGVLGLGVLFADPSRGFAAMFLSRSGGGQVLRRLLAPAILAPMIFGWIALQTYERGWLDTQFTAAVLVMLLSSLLVGLIVRQATVLHAVDAERERLLERERQAAEQVSSSLERITDGFFSLDLDWRFTYVNREAERMLRRSREELLHQEVWTSFPDSMGAAFEQEYRRAMAEQVTVQFEAHFPPLDAWFDVRAYPAPDGLSVYFRDVTDTKRAEERRKQSEARFRLLADMIPQHVWTTDPDGYHNYFSRRWYTYTGSTPEQVEGEGWLGLLHPDDVPHATDRWRHALRTGEPYATEYRLRRADGTYGWFLVRAEPLRDDSGRIVQWFGTLTDISDRKQHEEERERLLALERDARAESERRREELERVTESRARLMRGFGHDVKNPIGAAQMYAELLTSGRLPGELSPQHADAVARIRRSMQNALQLIDDLLALARAESGQLELEPAEIDVARLAREVGEEFRAQAMAAGADLDVEAPDGLVACADPARLRQILANLVANAIKYAPQGPIRVDADRRTSGGPQPGSWIGVSVIDSGPGIPAEMREQVFEEFSRLESTQPGAGIGLAISRRLARAMGGDLTVESTPGHGSRFTLWLPPAE